MTNPWPTSLAEAEQIQQQLRTQVVTEDRLGQVRTVAGVDAGYEGDQARAAIVVLAYPSLEPVDYVVTYRPALFPYVPGFLSFREAPAALAALEELRVKPDLLICDGQGVAHPRRLGIASHIGLLADIPAIGCAKSLLIGRHDPLPDVQGAAVPLLDKGEQIGVVLRSRAGTKPLYISVGHRISLPTALRYVLGCITRYRLPETTRAADGLASHGRIPTIAPPPAQGELPL